MTKLLRIVCSFFKMKYQQWLMRRVDDDLEWYVNDRVDEKTRELQNKVFDLECKLHDYYIRSDSLEMALIDADTKIEELTERLEVYEPNPEWEEEESIEESWNTLYELIEEMRWDSLERLLELL